MCWGKVKCRTRVVGRSVVYDHVNSFMIWRYLSASFHIINNLSPVKYVDTENHPLYPLNTDILGWVLYLTS